MHTVVALVLPDVVASDLSIPAQIFGHRDERDRYEFIVCAEHAGPVPSTTGFNVEATAGLEALAAADTVIIPGYWPPKNPQPDVAAALRAAGSSASIPRAARSTC